MGQVVVQAFMSLDGVVQSPGGPEEDTDGGFTHGGWHFAHLTEHPGVNDSHPRGAVIPEWESRTEALLLGRRTYDNFANAWGVWPEDAPGLQGELTRRYNRVPKHVASTTLTQADLGWCNSHLLGPDVPAAVAKLKAEIDGEIRVWGSTKLVRTLATHDLVDEYRILTFPLVIGTGKRIFGDGFPLTKLTVTESFALPSGIVVTTYRPQRG